MKKRSLDCAKKKHNVPVLWNPTGKKTRKRKKIYAGDLVSFNGLHFQIALKGETDTYEFVDSVPSKASHEEEPSLESTDCNKEKQVESKTKKTKKARKAISF